jgi:hypothetical protein
MSEPERLDWRDELAVQTEIDGEPHPADLLASLMRADSEGSARPVAVPAASPLESARPSLRQAPSQSPLETSRSESIPAAARALAAPQTVTDPSDPSNLQRTLQALRTALPVLQHLLPLLDGNVLGAIAGMLGHSFQPQQAQKPPSLAPIEGGLSEVKTQQRELRDQMAEQESALKRVHEQLDLVRNATDRNTQEQQDLIDELRISGRRTNIVAFLAFALLAASIAMNVVLYLEIHRLLP